MFGEIDHIGLAVHNLDDAITLYSATFGVSAWERIAMPERFMEVAVATVGSSQLELIAPTSPDAAFAKFLDERGPGMHHVAYRVDDVASAIRQVQRRGVRLIDETPRPGLHGTLVAFLHPKSTMGVLIELVQHVAPPSSGLRDESEKQCH